VPHFRLRPKFAWDFFSTRVPTKILRVSCHQIQYAPSSQWDVLYYITCRGRVREGMRKFQAFVVKRVLNYIKYYANSSLHSLNFSFAKGKKLFFLNIARVVSKNIFFFTRRFANVQRSDRCVLVLVCHQNAVMLMSFRRLRGEKTQFSTGVEKSTNFIVWMKLLVIAFRWSRGTWTRVFEHSLV